MLKLHIQVHYRIRRATGPSSGEARVHLRNITREVRHTEDPRNDSNLVERLKKKAEAFVLADHDLRGRGEIEILHVNVNLVERL
jgi:hypothetical protein